MDPLSLIIGATLLLIGLIIGSLVVTPLLRRGSAAPQAICSCSHGLGQHDEEKGSCHGQVLRKNMRSPKGEWLGDQWVQCICRHYDGPQPIEKYLATPTLPPRDGG